MSQLEAPFISIARITRTQGLKGAVRIEVTLEEDEVFAPGRRVVVAAKAGERHTEIEFFRRQHGRFIIKLRGLDDITEAEKWIGAEIKIPANELLPPKEGWFYKFQLKGCRVFSDSGEYLGDAADMIDSAGAQILKVVHGDNGGQGDVELLIPFAEPYIKKIDLDQQRIEVSLPQDLRELNK